MGLECSYDTNLLGEQALENFLSHLSKRLHHLQRTLCLLPSDAEARNELALLLRRWSGELEVLEAGISSAAPLVRCCPDEKKGQPEEVRCANPACSQTFWKWRPTDPQRFCSPACVRQMHLLAGQPSKPAHTPKDGGRVNPGVAEANRRRWAQLREQQAHEHALRLLAEAGLIPAEQETLDKDGS
jgi:hypothetical protein